MTLEVLDPTGHVRLSWDPKNEREAAEAKREFERLQEAGYAFFVIPGDTQVRTWDAMLGELAVIVDPPSEGDTGSLVPESETPKRTLAVPPLRGG